MFDSFHSTFELESFQFWIKKDFTYFISCWRIDGQLVIDDNRKAAGVGMLDDVVDGLSDVGDVVAASGIADLLKLPEVDVGWLGHVLLGHRVLDADDGHVVSSLKKFLVVVDFGW